MFDAIILRFRVAKVQAEIVAQLKDNRVRDQGFVNRVCQTEGALELINTLFKAASYKKSKEAVFLYATTVLSRSILSKYVDEGDREICYLLLLGRLQRIDAIGSEFKELHSELIAEINLALRCWEGRFKSS